MAGARKGTKAGDLFREVMKEKGMVPCPLCAIPGKWDVFHIPGGEPCPKAQPPTPDDQHKG